MPMPIHIAHRLAERLAAVRKDGTLDYLGPDGKTQVTVRYADGRPVAIEKLLISTQHARGRRLASRRSARTSGSTWSCRCSPPRSRGLYDEDALRENFLVNPTGKLRDRRPGRRRRPHRPQDHRRHLRRHGPPRRRRLLRQGPVEGRPLGRLRGPLRGQERRRRRPRRALRGPGRLRDRRRPPGLADGRDLRHRQAARLARSPASSSRVRPAPRRLPPVPRPAPADLPEDRRLRPLRPRATTTSPGSAPTAPTRCARPPASPAPPAASGVRV